MKKVVGLLVILFTAALVPAVSANTKPAIVIVDTAIDTTKVSVLHEVCIMEEKRCPNKQVYQEGPGAATMINPVNGFEHGTNMAMIAKKINPNVDIIFIRIVPATNKGTLGIYAEGTILEALKWVENNKSKFNIVATSISFGSTKFAKRGHYCPIKEDMRQTIVSLQSANIATLFASGNRYDKTRVDYPACIQEAVAVGAIGERGNIELYSNTGIEIDFYALGTHEINNKRVVGTSGATAALASFWAKSYKGSYKETYDFLKNGSNQLAINVG